MCRVLECRIAPATRSAQVSGSVTANFLPSATEGLGATPGRELLIADAPAGFARAVVALLRDPARRAALGRAAREFVAVRFDWATIVPGLEAVYGGEAAPKTL